MDWKLFSQLVVTFIVAAVGWWVAHWLTSRRDLNNERRKQRKVIAAKPNEGASLDELLFDIRQSLRIELQLEPVSGKPVIVRFRRNT